MANSESNLDQKQMQLLYDWSDDYKNERLEKVGDKYARNLVSRLLMKDPSKRPDASHVLVHPFLSEKNVARMIGKEAEYDVFLSYRVNSDLHHCKLMHEMLTEKGLKVWWDKKCLPSGVDWEQGFCEGLIKSRAFVALLSRAGMKNEAEIRQNFEGLTGSSRCDNVLLEYRLALELQSIGLLQAVFPVMIGDSSGDSTDPRACTYTNYSGCAPKCPDIVVTSVEEKLCEHLNNQGLGAPINSNLTVKDIYESLTKHQGGFIEGTGGVAFSAVVDSIYNMIKPVTKDLSVSDDGSDKETVKKLVVSNSESELDMLRSQKLKWEISRRELDILKPVINKIYALTSDTVGTMDPSGESNYSKVW